MEKVEAEGEERVEPAPLQVALLYKILKAQRETLDFLKSITPKGIDIPIPDTTVTDVTTLNFLKEYPYRALRSIDFFNKGPNTVYYRINEEAKEIPIEDREFMKAERPKATIEYVTLRVASGESATIKMIGHI